MLALTSLVATGLVLNPVAPVSRPVVQRTGAPVMAAADGFVPDMQVRRRHPPATIFFSSHQGAGCIC